jgi:hypothetical protein
LTPSRDTKPESAIRKKLSLVILLAALVPLPSFADEPEEAQQFSLSLDLLGGGAFARGGPSFAPGYGAALFGDWRPLPYLSLGTGFNFALHSDAGSWQTASWDLGGRIFPLGTGKEGEWYLQGTVGLELATYTLQKKWPGNFHGTAGPGYRVFVNPGNALDLGVQYDLFSPLHSPLEALGVKAGWTFLFGTNPGQIPTTPTPQATAAVETPVPTPTPVPVEKKKVRRKKPMVTATPGPRPSFSTVSQPAANAPLTYIWAQGDNLASIAEAYYGSGDDYPLLVDANRATLGTPAGLKPGAQLIVPQGVSEADKAAAAQKAGSEDYRPWKKVGAKSWGFFN